MQDQTQLDEFYPEITRPHLMKQPERTIVDDSALVDEPLEVIEFPDGSVNIQPYGKQNVARLSPQENFKENLAFKLDDQELRKIGNSLKEAIEDDIQSQSPFYEAVGKMIELMGIELSPTNKESDLPFNGAASVYSGALFETYQSLVASIKSNIFKSSDMVDTCIMGESTEELEDRAIRMRDWFNNYIYNIAKEYIKESMLLAGWACVAGSAYKKVYICPILRRPTIAAIPVEHFVVNSVYSNHITACRRTHILHLSDKDFQSRILLGMYKDVGLIKETDDYSGDNPIGEILNRVEGIEPMYNRMDGIFVLYECHADVYIEGDKYASPDGLPSPYIVTLDKESGQVLSINRNWKENDPNRQRIEYFVNYYMLTPLRGSGYGMVHYAGGLAAAATSLERQLINAAIYANFPGGVYQQGTRLENNNIQPKPGEFIPIMCTGSVRDAIQPLPYKEPSPALNALKKDIEDNIRRPSAVIDQKIADMPANAPVGTTIAILEQLHKVPNAILQNFYESLTIELGLLKDRFEESLQEGQVYPFKVVGGDRIIVKNDFREGVNIIPSGDPTTKNSAHRFMVSEIILNNAKALPDIYNIKYANELFLKNMGVPGEDITKLLTPPKEETPPPQPKDPVSMMMSIIKGEPVTAAVWQDHQAYIIIIDTWIQSNPQDPHLQNAMALKTQYEAFKYMVDAYAALGMPPPDDPSQLAPEQQNQLAVQIAHMKLQEAQQAQANQQPVEQPLDPAKVELEAAKMASDIAHEKNSIELKKLELTEKRADMEFELSIKKFEQDSQIQHMKVELESFKITRDEAIKERDQALKERDAMMSDIQHHQQNMGIAMESGL